MKPKLIVKLSNIIGIVSIILLIYWVFIFIVTQVFGFKVFRENMTETFYLSILGILALMAGASMINIMFNLTRIADKQNNDGTYNIKRARKTGIIFLISFPLIFVLLAGGDYLTGRKKEKMLINSAESLIKESSDKIDYISNYYYSKEWLINTSEYIELLAAKDRDLPNISVIIRDKIDNEEVYLKYNERIFFSNDSTIPAKKAFIYRTTLEERNYLQNIFDNGSSEIRFSRHNGSYELFYPYRKNDKLIILYFSDYQQYGKFGS